MGGIKCHQACKLIFVNKIKLAPKDPSKFSYFQTLCKSSVITHKDVRKKCTLDLRGAWYTSIK